jgi:uncharacterized protein (DUF1330 family)
MAMITRTVTPDPDRLDAMLDQLPQDQPVVMLNLLRYREQALYDDGHTDGSGRDAYARYGAQVFPLLQRAGAQVIYGARAIAALIAPDDETWDDILLVRYPSVAAFRQMVTSAEYQQVTRHRTAALLDSRLIATVEQHKGL